MLIITGLPLRFVEFHMSAVARVQSINTFGFFHFSLCRHTRNSKDGHHLVMSWLSCVNGGFLFWLPNVLSVSLDLMLYQRKITTYSVKIPFSFWTMCSSKYHLTFSSHQVNNKWDKLKARHFPSVSSMTTWSVTSRHFDSLFPVAVRDCANCISPLHPDRILSWDLLTDPPETSRYRIFLASDG